MSDRTNILSAKNGLENIPANVTSSPSKKAKLSAANANFEEVTTLRVKKLTADATLPKRGSARAAGYDLAR
jgi:hypothetical protein